MKCKKIKNIKFLDIRTDRNQSCNADDNIHLGTMDDEQIVTETEDCLIKEGYALECEPEEINEKGMTINIYNEISVTEKSTPELCRDSCLHVSIFLLLRAVPFIQFFNN